MELRRVLISYQDHHMLLPLSLSQAWVGCSGSRGPGEPVKNVVPPVGPGTKWDAKVLNTDYGTPIGTCTETAPRSGI